MQKNQKAFTLIELLVVVLIIGILSAIALPQYRKAVVKARATEMLLIGRSMVKAQQMYKLANGEYATDIEELDIGFPCTVEPYVVGTETYAKLVCANSFHYLYPSMISSYTKNVDGFWINFSYSGSATCSARDAFAEGLCLSLGATYSRTDDEGIKRYNL